jgi:Na+-translocating ferredoxin:NAD+ oxidoreductase subunit B
MGKEVYEKVREMLDGFSIGFKSTGTGVEIKLLEKLFTEEEAATYLNLSRTLQTAGQVALKAGRDEKSVEKILMQMTEKGLTIPRYPKKQGEPMYYSAAPYLHGILEHQVNRMDREMADLIDELNRVGYISRGPMPLRTVPINAAVNKDSAISPYEDVIAVLDRKKRFAVAECACAVVHHTRGKDCGRNHDVCFAFDFYADYYIERGLGREVTREEVLKILKDCDRQGLVPQLGNMQNPDALCNCCPDCCVNLLALKAIPKPGKYSTSSYHSAVHGEKCTACETCIDRCPMGAIAISEENVARVNLDRCIGCGLCVSTCPEEALYLVRKSEDRIKVPPVKNDFMKSSADFEADVPS